MRWRVLLAGTLVAMGNGSSCPSKALVVASVSVARCLERCQGCWVSSRLRPSWTPAFGVYEGPIITVVVVACSGVQGGNLGHTRTSVLVREPARCGCRLVRWQLAIAWTVVQHAFCKTPVGA
jgi:hypothetical protein